MAGRPTERQIVIVIPVKHQDLKERIQQQADKADRPLSQYCWKVLLQEVEREEAAEEAMSIEEVTI